MTKEAKAARDGEESTIGLEPLEKLEAKLRSLGGSHRIIFRNTGGGYARREVSHSEIGR